MSNRSYRKETDCAGPHAAAVLWVAESKRLSDGTTIESGWVETADGTVKGGFYLLSFVSCHPLSKKQETASDAA